MLWICYISTLASHPFDKANIKMKEQWGMQWSQRGSDDVITSQLVTEDVSLVSENRAKLAWIAW